MKKNKFNSKKLYQITSILFALAGLLVIGFTGNVVIGSLNIALAMMFLAIGQIQSGKK